MKEIKLFIRSRDRNTECDEMDWNLKEIEKKINALIRWHNEETNSADAG